MQDSASTGALTKRVAATLLMIVVAAALLSSTAWPQIAPQGEDADNLSNSVLTYHGDAARSGHFVIPGLTWDRARSVHLDDAFHARVAGNVYAQPLYWSGGGSRGGMLLVATEDNYVEALEAMTGQPLWRRSLGRPVPRSALRCGNINPLGITGTPVIDPSREALFLDADVEETSGPNHRVFALSLRDGSQLPGWPVDVAVALRAQHQEFNSRDQNERGALTVLDGTLYVPFGGHFGDCGDYHGWVVGISLQNPTKISSWLTRSRGGGIWAPGGITAVGQSLFVATGNTFGASTWGDGEAIIRLAPDLHRSNDKRDFFAPSDWHALDARDLDLGGSNPLLLNIRGATGGYILALGKDGRAYLLDRNNLGGIGGSLVTETVSQFPIRTAPAVYSAGENALVALHARAARCPGSDRTADKELIVLKVSGGERPSLSTAWCGAVRGAGSPIITTTDGHSDPVVWIVGAEGDNRLHAFRGDTGEPLFNASTLPAMTGLRHFQTLIATGDRLYVGADGHIYAFAF